MHRIRAELCIQRIATANQIRGLCAEYGLTAARELLQLRTAIARWLEDMENGPTQHFRRLLDGLWQDLKALDGRVKELDREIEIVAALDPAAATAQRRPGHCNGDSSQRR